MTTKILTECKDCKKKGHIIVSTGLCNDCNGILYHLPTFKEYKEEINKIKNNESLNEEQKKENIEDFRRQFYQLNETDEMFLKRKHYDFEYQKLSDTELYKYIAKNMLDAHKKEIIIKLMSEDDILKLLKNKYDKETYTYLLKVIEDLELLENI